MQLHVWVSFLFLFSFFFCALVWGDQGLPQYSPCVLWARGAWLSSCHTVAPGTCPVIWPDLLDLSADSPALLKLICAVECLQWSFSNQINGPNLVFQNPISFMCCFFLFFMITWYRGDVSQRMVGFSDLLFVLIWTHIKRVLGKCIPLLHWQQM